MNDYYVTFRSLTAAQRGLAACRVHGIAAAMLRTPAFLTSRGCSYCIRVSADEIDRMSMVLRLEGVLYEHVFRLGGSRAEEVFL